MPEAYLLLTLELPKVKVLNYYRVAIVVLNYSMREIKATL